MLDDDRTATAIQAHVVDSVFLHQRQRNQPSVTVTWPRQSLMRVFSYAVSRLSPSFTRDSVAALMAPPLPLLRVQFPIWFAMPFPIH